MRHAYAAFVGRMQYGEVAVIPIVLAMSYVSFVLLGAAEFSRRRVAGIWLSLAIPALLFRLLIPPLGPWAASRLILVLVLGIGWIWAGVLFGRADARLGGERWIPAIALVLMGLHQWSVLIFAGYPAYESWGMSVTLALQIAIGVGVLVAFERRGRIRLGEAHADLEQALTKALAGYIPICANCKSIRNEQNEWSRLEAFLSARTDAQLSHGICPDWKARCRRRLY